MFRRAKVGYKVSGGRNKQGKVTIRCRGGGNKRCSLFVSDFSNIVGVPAKILGCYYDRARSGYVALICYVTGVFTFVIAADNCELDKYIVVGKGYEGFLFISLLGSSKFLFEFVVGQSFFNVATTYGGYGFLGRAAGSKVVLLKKYLENKVLLKLPSKELRIASGFGRGICGVVSNIFRNERQLGKAGVSRGLGWRSIVRGVAKNPIDHPHGGNTAGGRCSVTPWGRLTKGKPTRKVKKGLGSILVFRRLVSKSLVQY